MGKRVLAALSTVMLLMTTPGFVVLADDIVSDESVSVQAEETTDVSKQEEDAVDISVLEGDILDVSEPEEVMEDMSLPEDDAEELEVEGTSVAGDAEAEISEEAVGAGGNYTVGDGVTAKFVEEGDYNVLYFDSKGGTLWHNWLWHLGINAEIVQIIKFTEDSTKMYLPEDSSFLFMGGEGGTLIKTEQIELDKVDTSKVKNMSNMFYRCESLINLDLSSFNTSNVTDMSYMFFGCCDMTNLDLSSFDTSNVTDMECMFCECCSVTNLDLSSFDTSNVTNMADMFNNCQCVINLDLSSFNTSNVTNMAGMFWVCDSLTKLDLSSFNTSNVTNMECMFGAGSLEKLDLSNFDTSNVTDMNDMFSCQSLRSLDLSSFDTSNVTDMDSMFICCQSLSSLDLSSFDTSNVTDMSGMFYGCHNITNLDLRNFDTPNVTDMGWMFYECHNITNLDLSGFNTSNVTEMSGMFYGCHNITNLDLYGFDTSRVKNMSSMFYDCDGLTTLDLSSFNTSNVTDMSKMFYSCKSLTNLDLSSFNTSNVTDMGYMFYGCDGLTTLDLSNFNTSNVTNMEHMFFDCDGLTTLDLSNFNTSNVTDMSYMFCGGLTTLDLSSFDMSKVRHSVYMLSWNPSLQILVTPNIACEYIVLPFTMYDSEGNQYSEIPAYSDCMVLTKEPRQNGGYPVKKEVEIMDEKGDKRNEEVSFYWDVETLEYRRVPYDYDLAIAAAYINQGTYFGGSKEETEDRMKDLGFEHFDQNHPYNEENDSVPWMAIGYQKCTVNGIEKKIVCLNVRGTFLDSEWDINIKQGWGKGYIPVGEKALEHLLNYCWFYGIKLNDPNTILFMAGHSLGGATISRLAIELAEKKYQTKVVAYAFGTPNYSCSSLNPTGLHTVWNEGDPVACLGGMMTSHAGQIIKFRQYLYNRENALDGQYHELDRYLYRTFHSAGKMSSLSANTLTYTFVDELCPIEPEQQTPLRRMYDKYGTKAVIHCPVDVRVYNSDNILVGDSTNDDFMFTDGSGGYIYLSDDEKYVFLPAGSNYRLDITGTDDGTMNVDIMEIDPFGEEINSMSYENVSIETDKHFILDAQSINTVDESDLFVVQDESVPVAFVQTDGTEVPLLGSGLVCEGVTWSVDTTGELAISGSGGIPSYTDAVAAPWAGLSDKITSVSIGDGITAVGAGAFASLPDLKNATVATTVTQIGAKAFSGCTGLETVLFYGDMPAIDVSAFEGLGLEILYYREDSTWEEKPDLGDGVAYNGYCGFTSEGIMMEHSFENETVGPDCTSFGYGLYHCTTCGYAYATDFVESPGHDWGSWEIIKDATEDADGEEQRSCLRCHEKETRIINKLESITGCTVTISPTSYTYDGSAKKPSVTVKNGTAALILDTDYIVTYSGNKNAGTATVTITGKGNYAGTVSKTFTINKAAAKLEFTEADISKKTTDAAFTNSLTKTTDGTVTFKSSNTTVATVNSTSGQVTIKGIGSTTISANAAEGTNYKAGSANYELTVTDGRTDITGCMITLSSSSYTYNGKERKPSVTVTDGTVTLTSGTDYTVSYSNNTNAGTAAVTITGKGVYTGTNSTTFTIKKATSKLVFAEADISKKTTDAAFTNALTKTTDGIVTFVSSDTKVAEVSSTSGLVTIKGAGTATITASAAEGTNYKAGSAGYTLTVETPAPASTPTVAGFSDVQDSSHPYYKAIYWAADAGITKGYSDGTFGINRSCTRGEMMMFLWRYAGKPTPKNVSKSPFKDVPKTHTFYKAILWGSQKGITKGYSDGTFGINRNVSRGECMMFLWRLKGKPAPKAVAKAPFPDVPKSHVFYNAVLWGYQKKITTGFTSGKLKGKFGVNENCSRGQIVTFLYRAK